MWIEIGVRVGSQASRRVVELAADRLEWVDAGREIGGMFAVGVD
ncbi:hypothetical protein SAMN05216174_12818 [Actinokineospora iranica]|uniref:Uncharacterized protein n=1 Tax=Actinokineospora iranica TaxID=1271860 RepID=A0A1G6ZCA6_9PSEU|nr:hypothetical protein SAMN05216174_12818 [Actinokineospora iranica]